MIQSESENIIAVTEWKWLYVILPTLSHRSENWDSLGLHALTIACKVHRYSNSNTSSVQWALFPSSLNCGNAQSKSSLSLISVDMANVTSVLI